MPKYIAIDRAQQVRSLITQQYRNTPDSILAILDCRSHKRASAVASEALKIPELSIQLYRTLPANERAWADNARVLDVPEADRPTGIPVGKAKTKQLLKISTWVPPDIAERYRSVEHKSAWVADAIRAKMEISN